MYGPGIPVDLAMNYASLVNDMQMCADGGTALDLLRFMLNLQAQTEKSESLVTAKTVKDTMASCFETRNLSVPTAWKAVNFVPNVLKFLKALGTKGFQEAERLQGFRSAAIFDILKQSRDVEVTNDLVLPSFFFQL